jgi:hypothetical protein
LTVAELGSFLAKIKDGPTATAAKEPLDALVKQLQTAKDAATTASGSSGGTLGGLATAAAGAAAKLGISEDVVKQIGTLLEKPEVKAALGATLEKLKSLVM